MKSEIETYFNYSYFDTREYRQFKTKVLCADTRYSKINFGKLLKIYKTNLKKEDENFGIAGLLKILEFMENESLIELPKNNSDWLRTKIPFVPKWVRLLNDQNQVEKPNNFKFFPWVPELSWISSLKKISEARFSKFSIINDLLNDESFLTSEIIAEKERSIQLFGEEKLLRDLRKDYIKYCDLNTVLRAKVSYEPLSYVEYRSNESAVLIVENRDTFYSINKVLQEIEENGKTVSIKLLIFGRGKAIISNVFWIFDKIDPKTRFIYFGDLDHGGFGIYYSLAKEIKQYLEYNSDMNVSIEPCNFLYEKLLDQAKDKDLNIKDKKSHRMKLPGFTTENQKRINEYLEKGLRIPQEILNLIELRKYTLFFVRHELS